MSLDPKVIIEYLKQGYIRRCLHGVALQGQGFYERKTRETADSLTEHTLIIDEGFVDSFGLVDLRAWIEKTFDVDIPDEMVTPKSFSTVKSIVNLIKSVKKVKK